MIILSPDGERTTIPLGSTPGLGRLQKAVGGYIEAVPSFDSWEQPDGSCEPCVALCNEEGKLRGLRSNRQATDAWLAALQRKNRTQLFGDSLVGNVLILTGAEVLRGL